MSLSISNLFDLPIRHLKPSKPVSIETGSTLKRVIQMLQNHRIGCVLVTSNNRLEGIITERDLSLRVLGCAVDTSTALVDDFMTPSPESLEMNDSVAFAVNRMSLGGYRHIPIVDSKTRPIGVISVKDIVNILVEELPGAVLNLPPEPRVYPASREGA